MSEHYMFTGTPFNAFGDSTLNLETAGDPHVALLDDSATGNINHDTDETWTDVSAYEIDPSANDGYTAGGLALTNTALTSTGPQIEFSADDPLWETSTITARHAIFYDNETDILLTHLDFEALEESDEGDFTIELIDDSNVFRGEVNVTL